MYPVDKQGCDLLSILGTTIFDNNMSKVAMLMTHVVICFQF